MIHIDRFLTFFSHSVAASDTLEPGVRSLNTIVSCDIDIHSFFPQLAGWAILAQPIVMLTDMFCRSVPFDSTPSEFDSQFFVETLLKGTAFPGYVSSPRPLFHL